MRRIPTIKSLMTPFPYSVEAEASLEEARAMMMEHGIHHLPVTHDGGLVGVVTGRDLGLALDAKLRPAADDGLTVGDVCTTPYVVETDERLDNVLLHMADQRIDAAVVLKDGRLAGIFTGTDACRGFGELLRQELPGGDGDQAA